MGDTSKDPVDHARTTRQHAGETMKNGVNAPGLILLAVGVVAMVISLAAFASGHSSVGMTSAVVAVAAAAVGGVWVYVVHLRVRQKEARWHAEHPQAHAEPPTS
jgi:tetrahydromethanopterin S-methyltransferase subunit C